MIAFPAFAQLADTSLKAHWGTALVAVVGFVSGLVFISISTLVAFLAMAADIEAVHHKEEFVKAGLNKTQVGEKEASTFDQRRDQMERNRATSYDKATKLSWWALGLSAASLCAFIVGSIAAVIVLAGV